MTFLDIRSKVKGRFSLFLRNLFTDYGLELVYLLFHSFMRFLFSYPCTVFLSKLHFLESDPFSVKLLVFINSFNSLYYLISGSPNFSSWVIKYNYCLSFCLCTFSPFPKTNVILLLTAEHWHLPRDLNLLVGKLW